MAKMRTTAELRNAAYEARKNLDFEKASKLYSLALARYPKNLVGASYEADKAMLKKLSNLR